MLTVENLSVTYKGKSKKHPIVKNISFSVNEGECVCILGESGSGKSMTMKAILGLLDKNFDISGKAILKGIDLFKQDKETLRKIRGKDITMVLQNPMICFDSLYRLDYQMAETFLEHTDWTKQDIYHNSIKTLEKMMINEPHEVLKKYPHQLSGGMLQRIMIGIALTLNPSILVADEPTTAIDAITQYEIMRHFIQLKNEGMTMIFITHDLGVASMIADRVIVMNAGEVVDRGRFSDILENATDHYTRLLVEKRKAVMKQYQHVLGGF